MQVGNSPCSVFLFRTQCANVFFSNLAVLMLCMGMAARTGEWSERSQGRRPRVAPQAWQRLRRRAPQGDRPADVEGASTQYFCARRSLLAQCVLRRPCKHDSRTSTFVMPSDWP